MKMVKRQCIFITLMAFCGSVYAAEGDLNKPQTMEDMWKIIQAQQQRLEHMSKKLEEVSKTSKDNKVAVLDRKTSVLAEEVEKIRTEMFIPEDIEYKSTYGLGPAASKVYQVGKGLSVGGY
ncbi:MAG: hypothetical protein GQ532_04920, partial [Methylomarinum sp.]|nr:hypothetical protein [Methylomarinum sp.]